MLNLFKSNNATILGIDVGTTAIKIIEMSCQESVFRIENYGQQTLSSGAIVADCIQDTDAVTRVIQDIITSAQLQGKTVVAAVPDSTVITRTIQLPADLLEHEIEELAFMEIDNHLPYDVDGMNIDFKISGKSSDKLDVLIVASRCENISTRVKAITKAGLHVKIMEVESYAINRLIQFFARHAIANDSNPFLCFEFSESINIEQFLSDAPSLMTACGLALRQW